MQLDRHLERLRDRLALVADSGREDEARVAQRLIASLDDSTRLMLLDVLAAAAPFGAAVLDGPDPLTAKVVQANPALEAMARGQKLIGQSLAHLIDPASRSEAGSIGASAA